MAADQGATFALMLQTAFQGRCPQCGAQTLFDGVLQFSERCGQCQLAYADYNVGDGPAALVSLVMGGLITALALTVEVFVYPPFWVHIVLWVPLTVIAIVASLRLAKAMLLTMEHHKQAHEGRLDPPMDDGKEER